MRHLLGRVRVWLALSLGLALTGSLVAFSLSTATAANPTASDTCKTVTLTFGNPPGSLGGQLSGCTSDTDHDFNKEVERNGSGQWSYDVASGAGGITWQYPFEGHGSFLQLTHLSSPVHETDPESKANSCPAGTTENEVKVSVNGDTTLNGKGDNGGRFTFEICGSNSGPPTATQEPGSKVVITEPPGAP
jgi:hypothetical protein